MFFKRTKRRIRRAIIGAIISAIAACGGGAASSWMPNFNIHAADLSQIPDYTGSPYAVLNGNEPEFDDNDFTTEAFEDYSELDDLGRCGVAYANICQELMPTEKRGDIGMVKPSGWHTVKYPDIIKDRYLYNRCHLIGYQLAGENANVKNLITGTRYLNVEGMLPFENEVSDYVKDTGNHVLYRVTPIFECNNLVASGVQIEAESVEDDGAGVKFNVYCYNVQPGIGIDYETGDSWIDKMPAIKEESETDTAAISDSGTETTDGMQAELAEYIINTNTRKCHKPECNSVAKMKANNKKEFTGSREELIAEGYEPCGNCRP